MRTRCPRSARKDACAPPSTQANSLRYRSRLRWWRASSSSSLPGQTGLAFALPRITHRFVQRTVRAFGWVGEDSDVISGQCAVRNGQTAATRFRIANSGLRIEAAKSGPHCPRSTCLIVRRSRQHLLSDRRRADPESRKAEVRDQRSEGVGRFLSSRVAVKEVRFHRR